MMDMDWIFEEPEAGYLDPRRLNELGDARPVWTYHFTTWQAFKNYVAGVKAGKREFYPDWCSPEEYRQADQEILRNQQRGSQR